MMDEELHVAAVTYASITRNAYEPEGRTMMDEELHVGAGTYDSITRAMRATRSSHSNVRMTRRSRRDVQQQQQQQLSRPSDDAEAADAAALNTTSVINNAQCTTGVGSSSSTARSSPLLRARRLMTIATTQSSSSSSPRVGAGATPASSRKHPLSQRKATPKASKKHSVSRTLLRTAEKEEDLSLLTFISADTDDDSASASPAKKQAVERERVIITATEINCTASKLFEDDVQDCYTTILDRPCVSARLFACYLLFSNKQKLLAKFVPGKKRSATKKNVSVDDNFDCLQPILAFLRAMVRVEAVSLGPVDDTGTRTATDISSTQCARKIVHFSSFDGSSTKPPVDREIGSALHQQRSIDSMVTAKEQIQALTQPAASCIQDLLSFLTNNLTDSMLSECATAIAVDYPPKRVRALADLYSKDLIILGQRLLKLPPQFMSPLQNQQVMMRELAGCCEMSPLLVEECLADLLGRGIRFHLRMFFNEAPPRLCQNDEAYEERSTAYSKVSTLVNMTMPDDVVANDIIISALVSNALCRLHEFFGLESMIHDGSEPDLPEAFCTSDASQRQLSIRGRSVIEPLTDDQCDAVIKDIREATAFLAAARAARFLIDLLTAPGVQEEIQRMGGGWSEVVETYASISWKYDLWKLRPADAHLVALCNYDSLLRRLDTYCVAMEDLVDTCVAALQVVQTNFRLAGTNISKKKAMLAKYPRIAEIASVYADAMIQAQAFPLVQPVDNAA